MIEGLKVLNECGPILGSPIVNVCRVGSCEVGARFAALNKPVKICFAFLTKAFYFRNAFILL